MNMLQQLRSNGNWALEQFSTGRIFFFFICKLSGRIDKEKFRSARKSLPSEKHALYVDK